MKIKPTKQKAKGCMILVVMQTSTPQCLYGVKTQKVDKDLIMQSLLTHKK